MANNLELAREFGKAVTEMRNYMRQFLQAKIKEHDIDISFELLEVMAQLWRKDGINQQELADVIVKDKSSMTYLVDNLVKRELITKEEDENDRRNKLIYVTKNGRQLQKKLNPLVLEMYEKAIAGITEAELAKALTIVGKINKSLMPW